MGIASCVGTRDPLRNAVVERRLAVEAGRHLEPQPGPAARHARDEADVEFLRFGREQAAFNRDPRCCQLRQALPRHQRIRILHGRDDARHAGSDQRIGTGRRAAEMAAGFQRDVGRGALRGFAGCGQRG
jgi:hypothetical protein